MKICILSDSHDHVALLTAAVETAVADGAEAILHCGDLVAPSSLARLLKFGVPIHCIHGNNSGDLVAMTRFAHRNDGIVHYHGMDAKLTLGDTRIFLVHYPHYAEAMAVTGDWDLVCCGHSHEPRIEVFDNMQGGKTTLVDPGTVGGVGTSPATWMLGDLESMRFDIREVDKTIEYRLDSWATN